MGVFEAMTIITVVGCGTGVIITALDRIFGDRNKAKLKLAEQELRLSQERMHNREARIIDLAHQNDQLQKQLEWHTKMLETQDRVVRQLSAKTPAASDPAGLPG